MHMEWMDLCHHAHPVLRVHAPSLEVLLHKATSLHDEFTFLFVKSSNGHNMLRIRPNQTSKLHRRPQATWLMKQNFTWANRKSTSHTGEILIIAKCQRLRRFWNVEAASYFKAVVHSKRLMHLESLFYFILFLPLLVHMNRDRLHSSFLGKGKRKVPYGKFGTFNTIIQPCGGVDLRSRLGQISGANLYFIGRCTGFMLELTSRGNTYTSTGNKS